MQKHSISQRNMNIMSILTDNGRVGRTPPLTSLSSTHCRKPWCRRLQSLRVMLFLSPTKESWTSLGSLAATKELSSSPLLLRALEPGIHLPSQKLKSLAACWQGSLGRTRQWRSSSFFNSCLCHSWGVMQHFSTIAAHQTMKWGVMMWGGEGKYVTICTWNCDHSFCFVHTTASHHKNKWFPVFTDNV